MNLDIRPFDHRWQAATAALINRNLGLRFGFEDPSLNPDLEDIDGAYCRPAGSTFLLAFVDHELVGTGALQPEAPGVGRVARMHTAPAWQGTGVGSRMLSRLEQQARVLGYQRLVLETNEDWYDAVHFYQQRGYQATGRRAGEMHFARDL